ncbi:uncharacterized protein [Chanodichthys erythropterus]|uniref:uncharacterized protein n=1 Tax=Chanodichthys erythropterus TaxID=933992 RepID=UPI00351F71C4
MEGFSVSQAPTSPMPHTTTLSAGERLIGLLQVGRSLERYVEEFVELAYLSDWPEAVLISLFLDGLDDDTIHFDEPVFCFSLSKTINLILWLNGTKFCVDRVQDKCCRPVHPESRLAGSVSQSPASSAYPSSELPACPMLDPHSSTGPSKWRRRKKKAAPVSPEPAPVSPEPAPVPVGILIVFEGMNWPSAPAAAAYEPSAPAAAPYEPSAPAAAPYEPSAPAAAPYEPSAPAAAAYEPSAPAAAAYEPSAPAAAAYEPSAPAAAAYEPSAPAAAAYEPSAPAAAAEPTPIMNCVIVISSPKTVFPPCLPLPPPPIYVYTEPPPQAPSPRSPPRTSGRFTFTPAPTSLCSTVAHQSTSFTSIHPASTHTLFTRQPALPSGLHSSVSTPSLRPSDSVGLLTPPGVRFVVCLPASTAAFWSPGCASVGGAVDSAISRRSFSVAWAQCLEGFGP